MSITGTPVAANCGRAFTRDPPFAGGTHGPRDKSKRQTHATEAEDLGEHADDAEFPSQRERSPDTDPNGTRRESIERTEPTGSSGSVHSTEPSDFAESDESDPVEPTDPTIRKRRTARDERAVFRC